MTNRITKDLKRFVAENYNNCVICAYKFRESDTAIMGYDETDNPMWVCEKCSSKLKEIAASRYFFERPYQVPESHSILWRYMDFAKYVSLLSNSALHFTRTDCFSDPYEGAKGIRKNKEKWDTFYRETFRHALNHLPPGCEKKSPEDIEENVNRLINELESGGKARRLSTYVNCWHENEHESEAMWKLYSSYFENAVAVKTTYGRLYRACGRDPSIKIGRVQYVDLETQFADINGAFWRKRKAFQHEREVRAILMDRDCPDPGKNIKVDLNVLIEDIYVSPIAPKWFIDVVNDINTKYGLEVRIQTSLMIQEPFF